MGKLINFMKNTHHESIPHVVSQNKFQMGPRVKLKKNYKIELLIYPSSLKNQKFESTLRNKIYSNCNIFGALGK